MTRRAASGRGRRAKPRTLWVALYARGKGVWDSHWSLETLKRAVYEDAPLGGITFVQFREVPARRAKATRGRRAKS